MVASEDTLGENRRGEGLVDPAMPIDALDGSDLPQRILQDAYESMRLFHDKLMKEGELRGLIGPRDTPILWERHILNSAAVVPFVQKALSRQHVTGGVADLGSGGGFPGIVIASCLRETPVTFIEPMERRIQWLSEVVDLLSLDNVTLLRARAEDVPLQKKTQGSEGSRRLTATANNAAQVDHDGRKPDVCSSLFNVVTCRAVAPMRKLAPLALPLLVPGGQLVALKGRSAPQELEKAQGAIKKARGFRAEVIEAPVGEGLEATHVVTVDKR